MYLWKLVWIAQAIVRINRLYVSLYLGATEHLLELEDPLGLLLDLICVPLLFRAARARSVVVTLLARDKRSGPSLGYPTEDPLVAFDNADDSLSLHTIRLATNFPMVEVRFALTTSCM